MPQEEVRGHLEETAGTGHPSIKKEDMRVKQKKREALGFGRIWINESLSHHFRSMAWKCRMLLKQKLVHSYWFFNGHLHIKMGELDKKIEIIDDVDLREATGVDISEFVKQFVKKY